MADQGKYEKKFWSLKCESETASPTCSTRIDKVFEALRNLSNELPELFPIPPKGIQINGVDHLSVFTLSDFVGEFKRSAEAIRSRVDYPFIMYFIDKCAAHSKKPFFQYMHTPGGQLYKNKSTEEFLWELIGGKTEQRPTFNNLLPYSFVGCLPSQETDRDHIHLPVNEEEFEKARCLKGGKWIVHCSFLDTLDKYWKNLTCLYDKRVLVAIKARTSKNDFTESAPVYHTKAIMCYTADADCKSSVKRAAELISICTGYDNIMFYKSNEASRSGQYRHEGCKNVAKYMFTGTGEMFEKDELNRWKKVFLN